MKDYYKILGLKKNASEEEIRERWIKLMRRFHPDQGGKRKGEDLKVQKINEAYQTLKHSSTRAEYDLRRMYHRKKGFSLLRKVSSLVSILILLLVMSFLYFKEPHLSPGSKVIHLPQIHQNNSTDRENIEKPIMPGNPAKTITQSPNHPIIQSPSHPITQSSNHPVTQSPNHPISQSPNHPLPRLPRHPVTPSPSDPITQTPLSLELSALSNIIDPTNPTNQINERDQINQRDQRDQINQVNQVNQISPYELQLAQAAPPPLLATGEEVKQFFVLYVECYTRKDLEGFLSLFSPKALQNQRDGMEKIREVYASFFNVSQEIRYRMEDVKIELYQNAVEVKARYEIDQTLKKGGKKIWQGQIRWALIKESGALKILYLDYQHHKSP